MPHAELTVQQIKTLDDIRRCEGLEVHKDDVAEFEELERMGLVTLGPARGPGRKWRRATLAGDTEP